MNSYKKIELLSIALLTLVSCSKVNPGYKIHQTYEKQAEEHSTIEYFNSLSDENELELVFFEEKTQERFQDKDKEFAQKLSTINYAKMNKGEFSQYLDLPTSFIAEYVNDKVQLIFKNDFTHIYIQSEVIDPYTPHSCLSTNGYIIDNDTGSQLFDIASKANQYDTFRFSTKKQVLS